MSKPDLDAIQARVDADRADSDAGEWVGGDVCISDREALLAYARDLEARIGRVEAIAETWRYKGEFGWGAWQEGHGPDPEGYMLDTCAGEIRAALTATDAS